MLLDKDGEDLGVPKSSELASIFVPSIVSRSRNFPSLYHDLDSFYLDGYGQKSLPKHLETGSI